MSSQTDFCDGCHRIFCEKFVTQEKTKTMPVFFLIDLRSAPAVLFSEVQGTDWAATMHLPTLSEFVGVGSNFAE